MLEMVCIELSCGRYNAFGVPIDVSAHPEGQTLWTPEAVVEFAMDCVVHQVQTIHLTGGNTLAFPGIFSIVKELVPWVDIWLSASVEALRDHEALEELIASAPARVILHNYQPANPMRTLEIMANARELQEAGIRVMVYQYVSSRISTLQPTCETYRLLRSVFDMTDVVLIPERPHHAPSSLNLWHITDDRQWCAASCMRQCHWPVNTCTVTWDHRVNYCPLAGGTVPLPTLSYPALYAALLQVDFRPCYDIAPSDD